MALLISQRALQNLSDPDSALAQAPEYVINDLVRIIKRAEIRQWTGPHVFLALRQSLTTVRLQGHSNIIEIALQDDADEPHFYFYDFQEQCFCLNLTDVRRLAYAKVVDE